MANEAILMFETELAIPINVVDGAGIEKGTVLQLADLFIGSASSAADQAFGGITKIEKIANDGNTKVSAYFGGIFKMVVGAAGCTVGFNAALSGANLVVDADTLDIEEGLVIGKFLETGTTGETVLVYVGKY